MANHKRTPDKTNPYRTRVGRIRYNVMLKQSTLDEVRRLAVDHEMSYSGFIEWAVEAKIIELQTNKSLK